MGKTAKKPEATTCKTIKGQTSLNSFFSKQPKDAQSKLFSRVLPTKKLPTVASSKTPAPPSVDDDDSDFEPSKKRKSPTATVNLPSKICRKKENVVAEESHTSDARRRWTEVEKKEATPRSTVSEKLEKAKKPASKSPPECRQAHSVNSEKSESCNQELTDVSLAPPFFGEPVQNADDTGCSSRKSEIVDSQERNTKDANNEVLGSPITVVPETPDAHHNSDTTRSRIFQSAHDNQTPTGKPFTTFVPETPESPNKERCADKLEDQNSSRFATGHTRLDKEIDRRKLKRGKLSAFSLLGGSPVCSVKKTEESSDLLSEMLEEFSRSAQSEVKQLPSGHKSPHPGFDKTSQHVPSNKLNPFKVGSKKTGLLSEITEDHLVGVKSPEERMSKSHQKCDQDFGDKQKIDPLDELLQEYAAALSPKSALSKSSNCPNRITVDSDSKPVREPFRSRQMVQAKRPLSKLSRTGRNKLGSRASPFKTVNSPKTSTGRNSVGDNLSLRTEREFSEVNEHCGAISSSDVDLVRHDGFVRDHLSGLEVHVTDSTDSKLLEMDLLNQGSKTKPGNPFAIKPSQKLKVSALHKTGSSTHSKMSAFKTKMNTRKRSVSKGNSPCAKRISANNVSSSETSLLQDSGITCNTGKKILGTGTAKKSLFREEKENLMMDFGKVKERSPRCSVKGNLPSVNLDVVETSVFQESEFITRKDIFEAGTAAKKSLFQEEKRNFMDLVKTKGCSPRLSRISSNETNMYDTTVVAITNDKNCPEVGVQNLEKASRNVDLRVTQNDVSSKSQDFLAPTSTFDSVWEDQLSDSELAAMDMEFNETQAGPQKGADSLESKVTKNFSLMSPFRTSTGKDETTLPADLNRYRVTGVQDRGCEKVLQLRCLTERKNKACTLKGIWLSTLVNEGDTVAVHGSFDTSGMCTVDQQNNFLVVLPDVLITGTNVSRCIKCMRRSVLSEKFKGMDTASKPMLLGTMLHDVFDKAIEGKTFSQDELLKIVDKVSHRFPYLKDMYAIGMTEQNILDDSQEYMGPMKQWANKYLQPCPKQSATIDVKMPGQHQAEKCTICVPRVNDIEETVWSPRWGIKGKVDLTVEVKIHQQKAHGRKSQMTVPLELKTGRETNSIEHRSQLVLYSLMLGDIHHHETDVDMGLLLYLKTGAMLAVPAAHMDKRELVHLRNQLAYYIAQRVQPLDDGLWWLPQLPPPIEDEFTCKYCPHLVSCSTLQRINNDMGDGHQLSEAGSQYFAEQISHLIQGHIDYFNHWYLLCALESTAAESRNHTKHIWTKEAQEREKNGRGDCLSSLVLAGCRHNKTQDIYSITFKQAVSHSATSSFLNIQVSKGDRVAVSVEKTRRIATCTGFVESIGPADITVRSERPLHSRTGNEIYRMDKDDGYNSMASSFVNLAKLMQNEEHAFRLRKLVIELTEPEFDAKLQIFDACKFQVSEILESLNCDQQKAIDAVQRSHNYTLIIGMPGTGKTTTIVALVRILCACGLSVLLTSYTHSAVDNILLKLIKFGVSPLRLGEVHRMHPEVTPYSEKEILGKAKSVQQLASLFETKLVVATTCLGAKHVLLSKRIFDVCIVDEASQVSQLVCLGPLFRARRFVLVGDHKQLPPLVQSNDARKLGMDESLFQRLGSQHESTAAIYLCLQYRMNADIMSLSNSLVYDGRLQCGNDDVATATLTLPKWESFRKELGCGSDESWLIQALQPQTKVCFLDTEKIKHPEHLDEKHTVNTAEAILVKYLVQCLIKCGCAARHIGVISPYRNQCKLLASMVEERIEVNTVDKYQGRDKEVIIVSFTDKDREAETSFLLQDMRRLNVALTRAKHKLIMIGCIPALRKNEPMERLVQCLMSSNFSFIRCMSELLNEGAQ